MISRYTRLGFAVTGALVVALAAGACGTTAPTGQVVGTSTPTPTGAANSSPAASSAIASESASSGPSASVSVSSEATPVPSADVSPGASAGGVAASCAGSSDNQNLYVTAANGLPIQIYCPVLPANWVVDAGGGEWRGGTDQWLQISYKGPGGAKLSIQEGAFCTGGLSLCSSHDSVIGTAAFGDLQGSLDALGPAPADGYAIYVAPGTRNGYTITGSGMSQDAFKSIAAGMVKVPKG